MTDEKGNGSTAISDFREWIEVYSAADETHRQKMVAEGVRLAEERREVLKGLIEDEPENAAKAMLSASDLRCLPTQVRARAERRFEGEGVFELFISDDFERGISRYNHYFVFEGGRFRAFFPDDLEVAANKVFRVKGFLINRRILLAEVDPL